MRGHPRRAQDRLHHAGLGGAAGAGHVERRTVIYRHPDHRNAERDVDAVDRAPLAGAVVPGEAHDLGGDVSLVVVHRHHQVVEAAVGLREQGIGRQRPLGRDAVILRRADRRNDLVRLLAAEQTAVAGVRVESRHPDARPREAEHLAGAVGQADHGLHPLAGDARARLAQRHVGGHMHHAQGPGHQQHRVVAGAGEVGVDLGLSGEAMPRAVQRLLVDRRRHGGRGLPRLGQTHRARYRPVAGVARRRRRLAAAQLGRFQAAAGHHVDASAVPRCRIGSRRGRHRHHRATAVADPGRSLQHGGIAYQQRPAGTPHRVVAQRLDRHLRPHPGRIAHRDRHHRQIAARDSLGRKICHRC